MEPNKTQLSALSRLFSSSVFREMARYGRSALFARLYEQTGLYIGGLIQRTVGDAFDSAFITLRKSGIRNEYVYRSALTHNILLGRHSLNTASILTEFRIGSCKADVAILNGTGTVYEIKSERDSLARLANQIASYRKVFPKIYVIAGNEHINEIINCTSNDIGVMSLVRWDRIHTVREATDRIDLVCPVTIFDSLRLAEARIVLNALDIPIPNVSDTMMYRSMRKCFEQIEPANAHHLMVQTLKRSRSLAPLSDLVNQLPTSLQPAALSIQVRRMDHERLLDAVRTPLSEAMTWG